MYINKVDHIVMVCGELFKQTLKGEKQTRTEPLEPFKNKFLIKDKKREKRTFCKSIKLTVYLQTAGYFQCLMLLLFAVATV